MVIELLCRPDGAFCDKLKNIAKTLTEKIARKSGRFTLGRRAFARISAVEGIHLTPTMEELFRKFDHSDLSAGDRRVAIARAFAKAK